MSADPQTRALLSADALAKIGREVVKYPVDQKQ